MNAGRTLHATFWATIALQTLGAVDMPAAPGKGSPLGGKGTRKMPAPRAYVAAFVLWSILHLVAETGAAQARIAARLSLLVLLVAAVGTGVKGTGAAGRRLVGFLNDVATRFGPRLGAGGESSAPVEPAPSEGGTIV